MMTTITTSKIDFSFNLIINCNDYFVYSDDDYYEDEAASTTSKPQKGLNEDEVAKFVASKTEKEEKEDEEEFIPTFVVRGNRYYPLEEYGKKFKQG